MQTTNAPPGIWVGQSLHLVSLTLLLGFTGLAWVNLGRPFPIAFWCAILFPVLHQVYVWFAWRHQLNATTTSSQLSFQTYFICFFLLFGGRFVSLLVVAWLDRGSLGCPALLRVIGTIILTLLGSYTMVSVQRYFGMGRASGADHFDSRYREMPLVKKGIFRFTKNGMYLYGFMLFWAIAVGFDSQAGLLVALFSHAYIWVHFLSTEQPDMEYLYASDNATDP